MFIVYAATGSHSTHTYYGYAEGDSIDDVKRTFMVGAKRSDRERGDARLFDENRQDENSLQFTILDVFDEEFDAWIARNEQRSLHIDAITGPSQFPGHIAERAAKECPETLATWKVRLERRGAKTAREAWALGAWANDVIRDLAKKFKRDDVVKDLDGLNPIDFAQKYSLTIG